MSFFGKVFKKVHHVLDPINPLFKDKKKNGPKKEKPYDWQTALDNELGNYGKIDQTAMEGATADSKAAGTWADTPAFQKQLQGEADAESRFGRRASLQKINSYEKELGLPETPGNQLGLAATPGQVDATAPVPTADGTPDAAPKPAPAAAQAVPKKLNRAQQVKQQRLDAFKNMLGGLKNRYKPPGAAPAPSGTPSASPTAMV